MKKRFLAFICVLALMITANGNVFAASADFTERTELTDEADPRSSATRYTVIKKTALYSSAAISSSNKVVDIAAGSHVTLQYTVDAQWDKVSFGTYEGYIETKNICLSDYCYQVINNNTAVYYDYHDTTRVKDYLPQGTHVFSNESQVDGYRFISVLSSSNLAVVNTSGYVLASQVRQS